MSESTPATRVESVSAETSEPSSRAEQLWLWSRLIVTVGAVLFAVAAWMPWVAVAGTNGGTEYVLQLSPGDVQSVVGTFSWSALTVFGVLLLPLFWQHGRRWQAYMAPVLLVGWLVFLALALLPLSIITSTTLTLAPELTPPTLTVDPTQRLLLLGFWLAVAAGVLLLLAVALFVRTALLNRAGAPESGNREARQAQPMRLPGQGALVAGLVLIALGTLAMPWAVVDCSAQPVFLGTCSGLSFGSAARYGIQVGTEGFDPLAGLAAVAILILAGGFIIIAGSTWGFIRRRNGVWLTLWLVVATLLAGVSYLGASDVRAHPTDLGLQSGVWGGGSGIAFTALGLVVGWLGLLVLWVDPLRRKLSVRSS